MICGWKTSKNIMSSVKFHNTPNTFCYICGNFMTSKQKLKIAEFVENTYNAYFGFKIQLKSWTPRSVCTICVEQLDQWKYQPISTFWKTYDL